MTLLLRYGMLSGNIGGTGFSALFISVAAAAAPVNISTGSWLVY